MILEPNVEYAKSLYSWTRGCSSRMPYQEPGDQLQATFMDTPRYKYSPHDEHRSSGPRPVKLSSDQ